MFNNIELAVLVLAVSVAALTIAVYKLHRDARN